MAIHSSVLAWTTPWTEEPGGLQSMGPKESHTTECRHPFHPGADWRPLAAVWEKTGVKAGTLWRDLEMVGFGVLILVHFNGGAIRTW